MITIPDLEARKQRLDELSRGLMKEVALLHKHDDPFLYLERKAYLTAIHDAIAGIETARVVLAKALLRIREQG